MAGRKEGEKNVSAEQFLTAYLAAKSLEELAAALKELNGAEWTESKINQRINSYRAKGIKIVDLKGLGWRSEGKRGIAPLDVAALNKLASKVAKKFDKSVQPKPMEDKKP